MTHLRILTALCTLLALGACGGAYAAAAVGRPSHVGCWRSAASFCACFAAAAAAGRARRIGGSLRPERRPPKGSSDTRPPPPDEFEFEFEFKEE